MTNCIRLLLVAILLLSMETFAHAADSGAALSLTLSQAVALAVRDNPDLALSRHRRQSAAISVEAARGRFLPSLQGSAGATQNYVHQAAPGAPEAYRSANAQLSADLNLFNGFADSADLDSSRSQLQAAAAGLERQGQTVAFTTASRFIAILADGELVQVAEQNLKSQQDLEQQIDAFYQAGVRAVTDLYQQQAATAQAEFALLDARRNLQVDQLQLLQTLGRTPPASDRGPAARHPGARRRPAKPRPGPGLRPGAGRPPRPARAAAADRRNPGADPGGQSRLPAEPRSAGRHRHQLQWRQRRRKCRPPVRRQPRRQHRPGVVGADLRP